MSKLICAIDPGSDGAIIIFDEKGQNVLTWVMPTIEIKMKTKTKSGNPKIHTALELGTIRRILIGSEPADALRDPVSHVFIEKQQPMTKPKINRCPRCSTPVGQTQAQGIISTFNTGRGAGLLEGMVAGLSIPYTLVPALTWHAQMFKGVMGADSKAKALVVAQQLFPNVDLRRSEKGRVPHDGKCDALCIGEFGRRILLGSKGFYIDYDETLGF